MSKKKNNVTDYLKDYFDDWKLTQEEYAELVIICENIEEDLEEYYDMINQFIENKPYQDAILDKIDVAISGVDNDDTQDT